MALVDGSHPPFRVIAGDRRRKRAASGANADAGNGKAVGQHSERQAARANPYALSVDGAKLLGASKPFTRRKGGADQTGASCQRPFRRRRLSVCCPPRLRIRWRNPWTRSRRRLEVGRRCFFMRYAAAICGRPRRAHHASCLRNARRFFSVRRLRVVLLYGFPQAESSLCLRPRPDAVASLDAVRGLSRNAPGRGRSPLSVLRSRPSGGACDWENGLL